jgi:hypothetical protein
METAQIPGWKALLTDWTDLVRHRPDGFRDDDLDRLVARHGGVVENTGGGVMVGFVRFTVAIGSEDDGDARLEDATATVSDEMVALWIGDEPFVEMPTEEVFAWDVAR